MSFWEKLGKKFQNRGALRLALLFPNTFFLRRLCRAYNILTEPEEMEAVAQVICEQRPCHLLVFGLGHDSVFYHSLNQAGRTVFLEDDERWFQQVTSRYPQLEAYHVEYPCRYARWREELHQTGLAETILPPELKGVRWDVIFVDGPLSYLPEHPGRRESIRLASELVKRPGDVFVHDVERELEDQISLHYLKSENVQQTVHRLRHFSFTL